MSTTKDELKDNETIQITLFRNLKFKMFFIGVLAECLEAIVDFKVDKKRIAFTDEFAKKDIGVMKECWKNFVKGVLTLMIAKLNNADINIYIKDNEKMGVLCTEIKAMLEVMKQTGQAAYTELEMVLWKG